MNKYSTDINQNNQTLQAIYDKANELLFDNRSPNDTIVCIGVVDGKQHARFSPETHCGIDGRTTNEIIVDGNYVKPGNELNVLFAILIEMVIQFDECGYTVPETEKSPKKTYSRAHTDGSRYYNATFKYEGEKHGLLIKKLGAGRGYGAYGLTDDAVSIIRDYGFFFTSQREKTVFKHGSSVCKTRFHAYCPTCGEYFPDEKAQIIRSSKLKQKNINHVACCRCCILDAEMFEKQGIPPTYDLFRKIIANHKYIWVSDGIEAHDEDEYKEKKIAGG